MAGAPTAAMAAAPDPYARLATVESGTHVRVIRPAEGMMDGTFLGLTDRRILVEVEEPAEYVTYALPLSRVESVWIREGHPVAGALLGLALGVTVASAIVIGNETGTGIESTRRRSGAVFLGALVGVFTGVAVGNSIHSHSRVYP